MLFSSSVPVVLLQLLPLVIAHVLFLVIVYVFFGNRIRALLAADCAVVVPGVVS